MKRWQVKGISTSSCRTIGRMENSSLKHRTHQMHSDGYRTPVIEDEHHPLNLWRSQQSAIDSYFPPQDQTTREQLDRFRRLENGLEYMSKETCERNTGPKIHLPWKERVKHTTWAYFTMTMATGGIANVLHAVPFRSEWLYYIGLCFFFVNILMYIIIWIMLLTRFLSYPTTFRSSLVHPTESLFVPAFVVSLGTICITIVEYGANNTGQWLTQVVLVLFWINVVLAITLSVTIYMILWSSLTFTIAQMTPIWIFPAYPLLIIGPHAANLSAKLYSPANTIQVIVGGFTVQGIGFLVSLTIYSAFVYRLMTQKLPADPSRPGMFVSVGPAAFTCSGTIGMAQNLQRAIIGDADPSTKIFMDMPAEFAVRVLRLMASWLCLWFWGLAIWFFFVSVISNIAPLYSHKRKKSQSGAGHGHHHHIVHAQKIPFAMTWYSYIFPQTALTTATFRVAEAFDLHALNIIGCVMTAMLIAMWFFVVSMMIRAIVLRQILWPDKGEDKEEGGFIRPPSIPKRKNTMTRWNDIEAQDNRVPDGTGNPDKR